MPKRGHRQIASTLRTEEVHLLDNWVEELEAARLRRTRHPETYLPTDATKVTRMGIIRAAVRYALEHRAAFVAWLEEPNNAK
jgi:hypothetical protein